MPTPSRIVLFVLAVSLSLVAAARGAEQSHQAFFAAVATGKPDQLTALMTPELIAEVDEPLVAAWMKAVNERLGRVTDISETTQSAHQTLAGLMTSSTARVQFENGTADATLKSLEGQLLGFDVRSQQLGDDWFAGPASTRLYQERGADLIRKILANEADSAYDLCHRSVRETIDRQSFQDLVGHITDNSGSLKSLTFGSDRMETTVQSRMLILEYNVTCRRASGTCEVKVQFMGLKGHLTGFAFR